MIELKKNIEKKLDLDSCRVGLWIVKKEGEFNIFQRKIDQGNHDSS